MDTGDLTLLSLWVHVPLVTAWIGLVMWDLFASATPGISAEQRGRMIAWSRPFVIVAIIVIMITGIWQTVYNPLGPKVTNWDTLQQLKGKTYGLALFYKHIFVLLTFALTVVVRFVLAPRLRDQGNTFQRQTQMQMQSGSAVAITASAATTTERLILWLSALNVAACLSVLVFATRMIWELH